MNKDQFSGKWHEMKGKIREKWGKLTNDDISQINGNYERFLGKLQQHYGYSKEQAERELHSWNPMMGESKGHEQRGFGREERNPNREREGMGREEESNWRERGEQREGHKEGGMFGEPGQKKPHPDQQKNNKKRKAS